MIASVKGQNFFVFNVMALCSEFEFCESDSNLWRLSISRDCVNSTIYAEVSFSDSERNGKASKIWKEFKDLSFKKDLGS